LLHSLSLSTAPIAHVRIILILLYKQKPSEMQIMWIVPRDFCRHPEPQGLFFQSDHPPRTASTFKARPVDTHLPPLHHYLIKINKNNNKITRYFLKYNNHWIPADSSWESWPGGIVAVTIWRSTFHGIARLLINYKIIFKKKLGYVLFD
jgi:hypothetical protein